MSILGSVSRYLKTYGRLMYADPEGCGVVRASSRRSRKTARAKYLEMLEPRVLMTTVFGGDVFQYTDALGNAVTVTLNGNVAAELVGAVQAGGLTRTTGNPTETTGGYLLFGDIAGRFSSGSRNGVIVGNGSLPVNNGTQGSPLQGQAHITLPGASYPTDTQTTSQVNLQVLATNASGQTYTFNIFDVDSNGSLTISALDTSSKAQIFTMQVIQLNTSTMGGSLAYTVRSDQVGTLFPTLGTPPGSDTTNTYTYEEVGIRAAAFNPMDNKLYFDLHYKLTFIENSTESGSGGGGGQNGTAGDVTYVEEIYSFNPAVPAGGFTAVTAVDVQSAQVNNVTQPRQKVTGMTFTVNPTNPLQAIMYLSEEPLPQDTTQGGTGGPGTTPVRPRIQSFQVAFNGSFSGSTGSAGTLTPVSTYVPAEGYGGARNQLTNVLGLAALPSSHEGGGSGYLFALVGNGTEGNGATAHLVRLDLTDVQNGTLNGTAWGNVIDLYESGNTVDGQSLQGFTYNPVIANPFTGEVGAFLSIDTATTNLDFINDRLRINAGDVFAVYAPTADINSSITFAGGNLYQGDSGNLGNATGPSNTGTVFIGYKGTMPDNSTNDTFVASSPYLTGMITNGLGVMPGLIADMTDPRVVGAPTNKLFAGLDVGQTLETPWNTNATAGTADKTLGNVFNNVSGMAVSPTGNIVVVNSFYYNGAAGDRLAHVNRTTGQIDTSSTPIRAVVLNNIAHTQLKNLQALAYGDPNLDGVAQLYAVYDLGDGSGPTLGTITEASTMAVFTPITALGLGLHGKVFTLGFTPGGTAADPAHESLYVVADPNYWDFNTTQYLYQVNMTFSGADLASVRVDSAPSYGGKGNVVDPGGMGALTAGAKALTVDATESLNIVALAFDPAGRALVLDRQSGRLMDLNLNPTLSGTTPIVLVGGGFVTGAGQINTTVTGLALDPVTLKFLVVDNLTGAASALTRARSNSPSLKASAILMQLKDFYRENAAAVSLGKFMVDGTISGKITVSGSMEMLYAGWLMTGAASTSWLVNPAAKWGGSSGSGSQQSDTAAKENNLPNNIYFGGDIRNIYSLTSIGTNGTLPNNNGSVSGDTPGALTGLEIRAEGKVGVVYAQGTFAGVVHAGNSDYVPGLIDAMPLAFGASSYDGYNFTFRGSATGLSNYAYLTDGGPSEAGSMFSNNTQPIDNFTASFAAYMYSGMSGFDGGFAFVLQNQGIPALGATGPGLGYTGILQSAALAFTYDSSTNSMGLQLLVNGTAASSVTTLSGGVYSLLNVGMTYGNNTLLVNLPGNQTISYAVNLASILASHAGYVGFTGGTGALGSETLIEAFIYNGNTAGMSQVTEGDIQHYDAGGDYTFGGGYLVNSGTNVPFDNATFSSAQYLGAVRSAAGGSDTLHLAGVLEGDPLGTNNQPPRTHQLTDWFAFSLLAGQQVQVSVTPRTELNSTASSATAGLVGVFIYDPAGNMVATDWNWRDSSFTMCRPIQFTADRPGAYRVEITGPNYETTDARGDDTGNISYDLTIQGAGNLGISAVTASGQIYLEGSPSITSTTEANPSIWVDAGDVGIIEAGRGSSSTTVATSIISGVFSRSLRSYGTLTTSGGYIDMPTSSRDIYIPNGSLRAMVAGQIGGYWTVPTGIATDYGPDIYVTGDVGLIQTPADSPAFWLEFATAAGGDIQVIDSGGNLGGNYNQFVSAEGYYALPCIIRTNRAIGIVRAAFVSSYTFLQADADSTGSDGVIDLIDVAGNWCGAPIVTGLGGNVRFMRVGGQLYQDEIFETSGNPANNGGIIYNPGPVTLTDDSGAVVTLTPSNLTTSDTSGTQTTAGQLTVWSYGVRGAGGSAILAVTSTTGLTVSAAPGGTGRHIADIGTISVGGSTATGTALTVNNGVPVNATGSTTEVNLTITSSGDSTVDVFDIRAGTLTSGAATFGQYATINRITDNTGGDIYNIHAGNVGLITTAGNLGLVRSTTGAALIPFSGTENTSFGGTTFPFDGSQYAGVSLGMAGSIGAAKSIGNFIASGAVGTLTANAGGAVVADEFHGITGLVVLNGTANATSSGTVYVNGVASQGTLTTTVSVSTVDIGQGIASQGSAWTPHTGLYASGRIQLVKGTTDVRANIISTTSIGTISLTNGSIINAQVGVISSFDEAMFRFNNLIVSTPGSPTNIDQPQYTVDTISISGGGGILGSYIWGSSIKNITVANSGFGIVYTNINGEGLGTIGSITAGGYGLLYCSVQDARVSSISATQTGAILPLSTFGLSLRSSETAVIDPATGAGVNPLTDLTMFMRGDGLSKSAVRWGLVSGVIGGDTVHGKDALGTVSAYDIFDSRFTFPQSVGAVNVRNIVDDVQIISGNVKSLNVAHDATTLEVTVAGQIGPVYIGGNFGPGNYPSVTTLSQIVAKGANGNIASVTVGGNYGGLLLAEGSMGGVTIGSKGTATKAGAGDLSGTITVNSNHLTAAALGTLTLYGSVVTGGQIELSGNVNTVNIGQAVAASAQGIRINGNLTNLLVGSDAAVNGSDMGNTLTISGNLSNAVITGRMSGELLVQGNLAKLAVVADAATSGTNGTDIFSGQILTAGALGSAVINGGDTGRIVAGTLTGGTITGNLNGSILGGKLISTAVVAGSLGAGASVSCALGDIGSLTVKGDINGQISALNGTIKTLSFTGGIGAAGGIHARTLGAITVPGTMSGAISATGAITSIKAGSVEAGARITAGSLPALTTTGDMNGALTVGASLKVALTVGRNFGGQVNVAAPLTVIVNGTMSGASITDSNALTALTVKGAMSGQVLVDRLISAISAYSMSNTVITAGQGLASLKLTGPMSNSLVQVGLARGLDNTFGTNDLNEQGRMGDLGTLAVGSMVNSIVAAGGNIGTFTAPGNMTSSSVSAGLVLQGAAIQAVLDDATPLAADAELNAARGDATLLRGGVTKAAVGVVGTSGTPTMVSSFVTAGVGAGAAGDFATPTVADSLTGGRSAIAAFTGRLDAGSKLLADTSATTPNGTVTLVGYTLDGGANGILAADPISGSPTATATPGVPANVSTSQGIVTVTITGGAGSSVQVYDDPATTDRLDTLVINGPGGSPVTVTVTSNNSVSYFGLGRVIATDDTVVSAFTAVRGDLLGAVNGGPSLWLDSDVTTFNVHSNGTDGTWDGRIGGGVGTMTVNQLGPGKLRVGGRITTLTVASSVGNPLLQQLGRVTAGTTITQIAYDPTTDEVYASDGSHLLNVNVGTGAINSSFPIHTLLTNATVSLAGLAFSAAGTLYGVATLNNQNPVNEIGAITTTGDMLRGLAVSPSGVIYAIDSQTGVDRLVMIDPTTGAETLAGNDGIIRDPQTDTFTNNITALAFDQNGRMLALTNDRDGNALGNSTASGYAFGVIEVTDQGYVYFHSPNSSLMQPFISGAPTNPLIGMAVNSLGTIYVVEQVGTQQRLNVLTYSNAALPTVTLTNRGFIMLGADDAQLVGIGVDENGALVGISRNATDSTHSELIGINPTNPTQSARLDAAGLLPTAYNAFAVGKSGANFLTYGYTTDAIDGGRFFVSPGQTSTLGLISTTGAFTQLLPLAGNATGAPLAGQATGMAVDSSGDIFAITDAGVLAKYSPVDGAIIGGAPIGVVEDVYGNALPITRIAFNADGELIGLNADGNNLVRIQPTTTVIGGVNVALATTLTEPGTADASDLTALSFATGLNEVLSFSTTYGGFVDVLGTSPDSIGGVNANSFGTVSVPATFSGHIGATGGGGVIVNGIDSIKLVGTTGTFTGSISAANSIGALTGTGVTFQGSLVSHADLKSIALTGAVGPAGVVVVDGVLSTFSLTGNFGGRLAAGSGATFTIKGSVLPGAEIDVQNDLATLAITGVDGGRVSLGSNKTFTLTGTLSSTAAVHILGTAGAITVTGGTQLGSLLLAHQGATTLTVGQTLAGVVGTRLSVTTATLTRVDHGVFAVGGDLTTLNVSGNVSNSILAVGTWIGDDGIYNTADDVIFGGSLVNAKINGVFSDSAITAGVLPRLGAASGTNNIPLSFKVYDYYPEAVFLADVDSAESGGITLSYIQNVTFAKPVVSSSPNTGVFSALVAANGITKVSTTANTVNLKRIVRTDPPGAPAVVAITHVSNGEVDVVFSEPVDTVTLNSSTIQVYDVITGAPVTDVSFSYRRQTADDGSIQGVLQINANSKDNPFGGASQLRVVLLGGATAPTIMDITGPRSALLDYNQDGVTELDPFGTQFAGYSAIAGAPVNDNIANATTITGFPNATQSIMLEGSNINATVETNETSYLGSIARDSVWWTWVPSVSGAVLLDTSGSEVSTTLAVYSGTAATFSTLARITSNSFGSDSQVALSVVAGTRYYIVIDGLGQTGRLHLNLSVVEPPANDNLANATIITGQSVYAIGTNVGATAEAGELAHNGRTPAHTVWWAWTAPSSQPVQIDTQGGDYPTVFSVYTGDGTNVATLDSIGEGAGANADGANIQNVVFTPVAGTTYYIAVDSSGTSTGNVAVCIIPAVAPPNDDFANATVIPSSPLPVTVQGNNSFATYEAGEPVNSAGNGLSVWWTWTADTTRLVTIDTLGSSYDTTMGVYTGTSVTTLSLVATNDQSPYGGNTSLVSFTAVAGTTYRISVDGWYYSDGLGNIFLNIY
jgi:hypothetical protein